MALSQFGQAFLSSLEENRPQEYQRLKASGELARLASDVDERANDQYWNLVAELRKQSPGPEGALAQAQHLNVLANQARELVLDEVLVRDPEESREENPPPDPSPEQMDRESARAHQELEHTLNELLRSSAPPTKPPGGTTD